MSDFTIGGTGYSFIPATQATAASCSIWEGNVCLACAGSGLNVPDRINRTTVQWLAPAMLQTLVNAGLLNSP